MSTTWFAKLDCNLHSNRKVLRSGRIGREVWVWILCLNAQRGAHGEFPEAELEPWYVAHQLGIPEDEARAGIQACIDAELIAIEDGTVILCGWNDEYGRGPKGSTERVRKHRAKKSAEKDEAHPSRSETRPDAEPENVTVATESDPCNACNVTGNDGNVSRNDDVTLKRRKEGEEGEGGKRARAEDPAPEAGHRTAIPAESKSSAFDPENAEQRGSLARHTWSELHRLRAVIARELGMSEPMPPPPITPATHPAGFRELSQRIREEGANAPEVCQHVLEAQTAQARKDRSLEWLSEKAFTEGGWRTARNKLPTWRKAAPQAAPRREVAYVNGREVVIG